MAVGGWWWVTTPHHTAPHHTTLHHTTMHYNAPSTMASMRRVTEVLEMLVLFANPRDVSFGSPRAESGSDRASTPTNKRGGGIRRNGERG